MVRFLKYYLSFSLLLTFACKNDSEDVSYDERKVLASKLWALENAKHGFNHDFQGTPKAMTLLESIIKLDSSNADALREISVPYLKRGIPHEWKPRYDKAVAHDPETWQPWRGYLYLWFYRDYKKAIADFDASDTLTDYIDYPQGHSVDFWRGIAYLGLKDYENSIAYLDKHITKETEDSGEDWAELEAFLYRGIAYYEAENSEKALVNFNKVIQYFKQSADAKYYKALVLKEKGNNDEARLLVNDAMVDFKAGFYNNRDYVETLRQIYLEDLTDLQNELLE